MQISGSTCLLLGGLLLLPSLASGQEPAARSGLWGGFRVGYSGLRMTCSDCSPIETVGATSGAFQFGWTLTPTWLLGLELDGWQREESDDHGEVVRATITWYPRPTAHGFIRAGLGREVFYGALIDGPRERAQGLGLLIAAGYDVRMSRGLSITPVVSLSQGWVGTTRFLGHPVRSGVRDMVVTAAIGVTGH